MKRQTTPNNLHVVQSVAAKITERGGRVRTLVTVLGVGLILTLIAATSFYSPSSAKATRTDVSGSSPSTPLPWIKAKSKTIGVARTHVNEALTSKHFWSALISRRNVVAPPPADEAVATFAVDNMGSCTSTPKTSFVLGEKVCAVATNAAAGFRQFNWAGTAGFIRQSADVTADPDSNIFSLPTDNTSVIDGQTIDNRGTWSVSLNSIDNSTRAIAYFNVSDPDNAAADLVVYDFSTDPDPIPAGANTGFFLWISNKGPDAAANVHVTQAVPPNMSYQNASTAAAFTCAESAGVVDCSLASSWPSGAIATITLNYTVSGAAPNGVISSTANISSDTNDPRPASNSSDASVEVRSAGAPPATCALGCPADIVVTANATQGSQQGAFVTFAGSVEVSGDCGTVNFSPTSGSFFAVGSHPVSVSSSSGGGSCSFTVTVLDTPAPTISCPADQSAVAPSGSGEANVSTGTPTATGTGVSVSGVRSDGRDVSDPYPVGTTTITWTATDSDHRTASCVQHVTVTSADFPTISCPSDKTFDAAGDCQKTVTADDIGTPTAGPATGPFIPVITSRRSDNLALTDPYPVGQTIITWTASNDLGQVSCIQTITITASGDTTPPSLTVPPDVSVTTDSCSALLDDELGVATATDNCSAVSITRTGVPTVPCPVPGNPTKTCETFVFPVGTTDVTYTATDGAGNSVSGVQHVTLHETTPPTFTFVPGNLTINTGPGATSCDTFIGDATLGTATVADNCDTTVIRSGVPAGNIFSVGTTVITYTAKADLGVTATQTVTVVDNTAPVVTAPGSVTLYTGTGATSCGVTVSNLDATLGVGSATDNCQVGAVVRSGVPMGNAFPVGQTTLTYSATDAHGNTGSATQVVTVIDNTPPVISCQASIVADYDVAVNGAAVTFSTPVGTDNCPSTTTQTAGLPSGSVFPAGTTTNTFTVTDASGNSASCSFTVTVAITSVIGLDSATASGNVTVDSYNSSIGYPTSKSSLANLLSNGTVSISGSSKVFGNVRSARVGVSVQGTSQVNGNATAGTTVSKGASAVITGTTTNNALAPLMTLPSVVPCSPFSSSAGISGTYAYNSSTGDLTLSGINIATLANGNYCFHNVTLTNSAQLKVNGPVVIKLTGTLSTSGASSLNNTTQIPSNLRILSSLSGGTGITFGNSATVYVLIYAPTTGVNDSGSAPVFGEVVGKSVTISNSGAMHYDTTLKNAWPALWPLIFGP